MKKRRQVIRSAAPVTQNHLSKPTDLMLQNATTLRKSAPWPPNISDEHVFCTALAGESASLPIFWTHACHPFWKCYKTLTFCSLLRRCTIPCACHAKQHLNLQKWSEPLVFLTFWLRNVPRTTTACTFSTSQLLKMVRPWCALYSLTSKCASRHNGVHFFDYLNFQKWSENGVLCTFWHRSVLRATTACNSSSLIWPDGSAPAALASLLFDPPEPQITGKKKCVSRLSYLFAHLHLLSSSFFWPFLFSDLLWSSLFCSSLFYSYSHLCF